MGVAPLGASVADFTSRPDPPPYPPPQGGREKKGKIILVLSGYGVGQYGRPYGHGLSALGLDPARIVLVETAQRNDALWAMEEALRSGAPAAVAGAIDKLDLKLSQRLHLAAVDAGLPLLLLRPAEMLEASASATRWRVGPAPAARDRFGLFLHPRWHLLLERCRNGRAGEWTVEYDHVAHRFSLAAALADPAFSRGAGEKAAARSFAQDPIAPEQPFVLTITTSGGPRVAALNAAAEAAGLAPGEPLADARAKAGFLQARAVDPAADDAALKRLTLWATRYTPTASPWNEENGADGFFLDIEGAAHLFGGEEALLADLARRLSDNFGLPARLAVAATPGAAWALARFHPASCPILPAGEEAAALARLPVEALAAHRAEPARRCAGSASRKSARSSTSRARPLPRAFPPNSSAGSTRRSAASRSRSSPSCRRRSITACVISSIRSSPRRPSSRWRAA